MRRLLPSSNETRSRRRRSHCCRCDCLLRPPAAAVPSSCDLEQLPRGAACLRPANTHTRNTYQVERRNCHLSSVQCQLVEKRRRQQRGRLTMRTAQSHSPGSSLTRSRRPPAGCGSWPRGCSEPPHADTYPPPGNIHRIINT